MVTFNQIIILKIITYNLTEYSLKWYSLSQRILRKLTKASPETIEYRKLRKRVCSEETKQNRAKHSKSLSNKSFLKAILPDSLLFLCWQLYRLCCWWWLLNCLLGHFLKFAMWKLCHPEIRLYKFLFELWLTTNGRDFPLCDYFRGIGRNCHKFKGYKKIMEVNLAI